MAGNERGARSFKPATRGGGIPQAFANTNGADVLLQNGPAHEFESFFQSFSGVDYRITAVVPYRSRVSPQSTQRASELQDKLTRAQRKTFVPGSEAFKQNLLTINSLRLALADAQSGKVGDETFYKTFGQLQTLTITSRRSVEPVRRLGEASPAAYTKGPRTFAGSMVFIMLKEDPLLDLYRVSQDDRYDGEPFYVQDRMPPFNILIDGVNEYGHVMQGALFGVTLIADGTTLSIDDLYTEVQYTYVARHRLPFTRRSNEKAITRQLGLQTLPLGRGPVSAFDPFPLDPLGLRQKAVMEKISLDPLAAMSFHGL